MFEVLEVGARHPVHIYGLDMLVRVEILFRRCSFRIESGIKAAQLFKVNPIAFGHFICHGLSEGRDDSLIVAPSERRAVEDDIIQKFVQRQRLLILCAGIGFLAALRITWVSTHYEGIFHTDCSFLLFILKKMRCKYNK